MRKISLFLILVIATVVSFGQATTPEAHGLKQYSIQNDTLGTINFYVSQKNIDKEKPLLVFLDGSGFFPLYTVLQKPDGSSQVIGTVHSGFYQLAEQFHFVVISKPGIPFSDSLQAESFDAFAQQYTPSKEYNEQLTLEWRMHSASLVIDYLNKTLPIKDKHIVAVGYSEGGQVVPKLALTNKKITKIVNIVGGGLNQFYDFITAARLKAQKGIITHEQAQQEIDSLTTVFKDIYAHPTATDKFWYGHTYKRWASFCSDIPLHNMLQLNIPILMIAGGHDENSPITGMDYVPLEFVRHQKQNLTYKVYPNCDHWFNDQELNDNRFTEMIAYVTNWLVE